MPVVISGSTGISGTDGTAATPAIQGTDTNTGIFFPAADTIAFSEGGVEAMRINSSGIVNFTSTPTVNNVGVFAGPAFSAMNSTTPQTITSTVATKVNLTVELFDTANCFDPVTNYRFTPNISGYYNINASIYVTGSSIGTALAIIYRNGSPYIGGAFQSTGTGGGNALSAVSSLIFMNGTTDFLELYAYVAGTGTLQLVDAAALGLESQMSGFLARAA